MHKSFFEISPPPPREDWLFLDELRQPEIPALRWHCKLPPDSEHLDISGGLKLVQGFPDSEGLLATAYQSLQRLLEKADLPQAGELTPCRFNEKKLFGAESYELIINADGVSLQAEDREGMRRAIYELEELLSASSGPFLPFLQQQRKPWLKNRISRCFFGPIKRPPFNRDELLDDMDYYPDEYLNRLAREGINGLWLTVVFRELASTSFLPKDPLAEKRLAKLRRTVEQCRRYGIKTWLFSIEPRNLAGDDPILQDNPELRGALVTESIYSFCSSSEKARRYLFESCQSIFSQVPNLGGLINISHGERVTSCLSALSALSDDSIDCPRCSKIPKWQIHHNTLSAMRDGMLSANADAEIISWLYQPQPVPERAAWNYELAANVPEGVVLQYNFESGAVRKQLSRPRFGGDYWLSYVGPSASFNRIADAVKASCGSLSAKIQVGCCHEVATVPFVPVPGLLYQKYVEMKKCACTHVMQCWYFGNYPGIMNRAAGRLAFSELEQGEEEFLLDLARPQWGANAAEVARAWQLFSEAYSEYPLSNDMQYYGPMHAGPVWPLHLKIKMLPLAPTWKPDYPPSGDCIGECLENHSLEEALLLASRMRDKFDQGLAILSGLRQDYKNEPERLLDIGVAEALAIQFRSARNIFEFYWLRRELFSTADGKLAKARILAKLKALVLAEIENSSQLALLCAEDSRLGFHSEAEAHQYFGERLHWRIKFLQDLLDQDFVEFAAAIENDSALPQSQFQLDCPRYKLNSAWYGDEHNQWRLDRLQDGGLQLEFRGLDLELENESVGFNCVDAYGCTFPLMLTVSKDAQVFQLHPLAECEVEREGQHWHVRIKLPSLIWNRDAKLQPRYIYLYRVAHKDGDEMPILRYDWPEHPEFPRIRLNIYNYQGNFCGEIVD